ncbi:MAG: hypothetical protein MUP86_00325 [Dehalococcoidia bacterium]|nr:hypothetical protein [Dehalococcoidia bacterium]
MTGTTTYPGALDDYGSVVDSVDTVSASHVNDARRAIEAIETELGTTPSGDHATLKARLEAITAQIFLSAGAAVPKTTAGCAAAAQSEMATNKQNLKTLDFDPTTEEHADFTFALPSDYNGGTMTAKLLWMHPATTTNFGVVWGIAGRCYADGDALDAAPGTEVKVDDTGGTTSDVYISPATAAITWAGTPAAGQLINLTVARKPGEAGDTMAVDAKLIGVQLTYVRA